MSGDLWSRIRREAMKSPDWKPRHADTSCHPREICEYFLTRSPYFRQLLGYSCPYMTHDENGQIVKRRFKSNVPDNPSNFYMFNDYETDGGAILLLDLHSARQNYCHIKCLYVSRKWERMGIAWRALGTLMDIIDAVDRMCWKKTKFKGEYPSYNCYNGILCPNSFSFDYPDDWDYSLTWDAAINGDECNIDWGDPESSEAHMIDERLSPMRSDLLRVDWKDLQRFYEDLGWCVDEKMTYVDWYDDGKRSGMVGMRKIPVVSQRSETIGRKMMTYQPERDESGENEAPD